MRRHQQVRRLSLITGMALAACALAMALLRAAGAPQEALAAPAEWRVCNTTPGFPTTGVSAILSGSTDIFERADTIIAGENQNDLFGFSLGGGDLDGDDAPDLILGSRSHVVGDHPKFFEDAVAIYVLYGSGHAEKKLYLPVITK